MFDGSLQTVLRCPQCNKPFDKQSTLKRHGYYCRSRKVGVTSRVRSCIACAKSKARCDTTRPKCSRCSTKGIECLYPAKSTRNAVPRVPRSNETAVEQSDKTPSLISDSQSVGSYREPEDATAVPVISDLEFANLGTGYADWGDLEVNFADFLDPKIHEETVQYASSGTSLVRRSPSVDRTARTDEPNLLSGLSIPATPSMNVRSLAQRPTMHFGAQRIAKLILHTLKSYPRMMLQQSTLPPFIHPQVVACQDEQGDLEPLTNCINLVHMISSGFRGSRKLFWKNVRLECEHMIQDYASFDKWKLLTCMQALTTYILIRVEEGETEHNNVDGLLIAAVVVISKQVALNNPVCKPQLAQCNWDIEKLNWEDWIFEETRRRIGVICRVVDMLVYFEPAAMCDLQKDLIIAPLPAQKQLWEASDELTWKLESERAPLARTSFGLAANGGLVKLSDGLIYCGSTSPRFRLMDSGMASEWEEWCSGMDGLGGLVMLAASLVG